MQRLAVLLLCCALLADRGVFLGVKSTQRHGPFWAKYQQLQRGMTEQEVQAILGPPMYQEYPGGSVGPTVYAWHEGKQIIVAEFSVIEPSHSAPWGLVKKRFLPNTWWERLWGQQ